VSGESPARTVYSWPRGRDEEIRASIRRFRGRLRADLRIYFADADDVDHPTKRGISIRAEDLHHLRAAVEALEAAVAEERAA
jgi:hypothetical protein